MFQELADATVRPDQESFIISLIRVYGTRTLTEFRDYILSIDHLM